MHHRVPVDLVHLLEGHVAGDAGVVDQHIHRAELFRHLADAGLTGFPVGDIAGVGVKMVALLAHRLEPLRGLGVGWRVGGGDGIAELRQFDADGFAQPPMPPVTNAILFLVSISAHDLSC